MYLHHNHIFLLALLSFYSYSTSLPFSVPPPLLQNKTQYIHWLQHSHELQPPTKVAYSKEYVNWIHLKMRGDKEYRDGIKEKETWQRWAVTHGSGKQVHNVNVLMFPTPMTQSWYCWPGEAQYTSLSHWLVGIRYHYIVARMRVLPEWKSACLSDRCTVPSRWESGPLIQA